MSLRLKPSPTKRAAQHPASIDQAEHGQRDYQADCRVEAVETDEADGRDGAAKATAATSDRRDESQILIAAQRRDYGPEREDHDHVDLELQSVSA